MGEYGKAEEYFEKALAIRKEIGDKQREASDLSKLGTVFCSLGNYDKAKEYHKKALAIREEIGDRKGEAADCGNLGTLFYSLGEYDKAKEYLEKALAIRKEIGDREGEAADYGNLGTVFCALGEYGKAKEYLEKATAISKEIKNIEGELRHRKKLAYAILSEGNTGEAFPKLLKCVNTFEDMRSLLKDSDEFKVCFSDEHAFPFRILCEILCAGGNPSEALYVLELRRARALADLMSAQYCVRSQISANPQSWVGIDRIMEKESNCVCLYLSYFSHYIHIWILKPNVTTVLRQIDVYAYCNDEKLIRNFQKFLAEDIVFRELHILSPEQCEDRSWFPENSGQPVQKSSEEEGPAAFRLFEDHEEEDQEPEPSLSLYYKLMIAPLANLLDEPEIIIVPDRSLYNVPFAALKTESGEYLSETLRIRIVPSLITLKLIQDSPADYHSQNNALIVGDPEVGHVMYKGRLERKPSLPCARKEAQMIGRLLGSQPLIGKHATKEAVLEG